MTLSRRLVALVVIAGSLVLSAPVAAQATTGCSQTDSQASAQTYLDALIDRNAAWSIPLHPFVLRLENGVPTSVTAADLRLQLYLHVQYSVFESIENVVWTWQPDGRANVINATYDIPVELADQPFGTSTVDEDFTLTSDCRIRRIDATFTIPPPA